MKKTTWIGVVVVILVIALLVLSQGSFNKNSESVKIGAIYTLTGPIASYGEFQKQSAETAVKEINDAGGINGKPVELFIEDSASDAKKGVDALNALKLRGVKFYIVEYSPVAVAVKSAIVNNGDFVMTAGATAPTYVDGNNLSCRLTMTAADIAPTLATYSISNNQKKAALLLPNNEYGKGLADEFTKKYTAAGGVITISEFYDPSGPSDFRTNITKIKAQSADIDVLVTVNAANTVEPMFQQLKTLGWNKPILSDYNTIQNPSLKDKNLIEKTVFVDWLYTPEPAEGDSQMTKAFKEKYLADHQSNPSLAAAGYYDAVKITLDAIKKVGDDPKKVAEYIQGLKNYPVITGNIVSFNSDCQATQTSTLRKVEAGKFVEIK